MNLEDILMRIVKIAVAIGAIAFAGLLVLGEFNIVTHHLAETWHEHLGAVLWIALCLCVAWMFLRRPVDPVGDVHCPHCRSLGGHKFAPQYRGSINHALFHFGGFLLSIFFRVANSSVFAVATVMNYSILIPRSLVVIAFCFFFWLP